MRNLKVGFNRSVGFACIFKPFRWSLSLFSSKQECFIAHQKGKKSFVWLLFIDVTIRKGVNLYNLIGV